MKKRLRKKKRVGEFREWGFEVSGKLRPDANFDAFLDDWTSWLESRGLSVGGGGGPVEFSGFVAHAGRGSATNADRIAADEWLRGQPCVMAFTVGELVDAWR